MALTRGCRGPLCGAPQYLHAQPPTRAASSTPIPALSCVRIHSISSPRCCPSVMSASTCIQFVLVHAHTQLHTTTMNSMTHRTETTFTWTNMDRSGVAVSQFLDAYSSHGACKEDQSINEKIASHWF
uniref:Uncharacterized protein n=1 Tax=Physcomitrium patens TaxID=3218 RepID=A0A2K1JC51_PHYPA|nr:hypothetical protein PHYPA_019388 [Physcomitrium patens]